MLTLALIGAAALAAPAPPTPPGLQAVPLQDVLVGPIPKQMSGCVAAMGQASGTLSRWLGCGDRSITIVGSLPVLETDVLALMADLPANLGERLPMKIGAHARELIHAGQRLPGAELQGADGGTLGLTVAWEGGVMREVGLCLADDADWCATLFQALLTPARIGESADPFADRSMELLMEPAPAGSTAENKLLQPVPAPEGGRMVGCHRYVGMDDPAVERLDCTQGRLVAEPLPPGFDLDRARAHLLPYLSLEGVALKPAGNPQELQIGDQRVQVAPVEGDGLRGFVVVDPSRRSPRAVGCLDRAPGLERTPWCAVAVETLWGPAAGDVPAVKAPPPPKP